jgi:hypothetical protein
MFKNNFVVAVKSENKILREDGDTVFLPFNSHYTLLLKNLDSRRSLVKVYIDDEDVLNGNRIIINSKSEIELAKADYNFKFIERTDKIGQHCGIKVEDGIIRVEINYEEPSYACYRYTTYFPYSYKTKPFSPLFYDQVTCCSNTRDTGVIIKDEDITQKSTFVDYFGNTSETTIICLKLVGSEKPLFVKTKVVCSMCGAKSKSNDKFCSECGTRLWH